MPIIRLMDVNTREIFSIYYKNGATIKQLKDILKKKGYKPGMELYYYDDNGIGNVLQDVVDISSTLNESGKPLVVVGDMVPAPVPAPAPEMPPASAPVPVETRGTSDGQEVTLKINGNPSINKVVLSLKLSDTVGQVKDMIQRITGIPVDEQKLIFGGRPLIQDDKTFGEYRIYKEELHTITVNQETKEHRIDTLLTLMVELPKRQASEMEELQQRQAEEIEQLRQRHTVKIEELQQKHAEEKEELPQRQADLEHLMQGLTGGGNRVRRRRNSRKTKRTSKRRSLKKRSRKRRSLKRRSRK